MKRQGGMFNLRSLTTSILLLLLLAGCAQLSEPCPPHTPGDLSGVDALAWDDALPFRFPLDGFAGDAVPASMVFCAQRRLTSGLKYHAAEDFLRPAGTPVYAMADGKISFSGPMGGYGWLIIVDHPQANLYSLYGHLSPSRWRKESGTVVKGELLAYLGDSDENGGSAKRPLRTHLHFGLRAGQRSDYSGMGEWRWQAGWIKPCPSDLGWLQPSVIIINQDIPEGGFQKPEGRALAIWGLELLFTGVYLIAVAGVLISAIRKNKPFVPILASLFFIAAGWVFHSKGMVMSYALFSMAVLLLAIGIYMLVRRSAKVPHTQS